MKSFVQIGSRLFQQRDIPPPDSFDAVRGDGYRKEWVLVGTATPGEGPRLATPDEVKEIEAAISAGEQSK